MRRVPCAVSVNLRKVTGDELRIVCSAVQYCVLYRPNCAPNPENAVGLTGPPYAVLVKARKMPGGVKP